MRPGRRYCLAVGAVLVGAVSVVLTVDFLIGVPPDPGVADWIFVGVVLWAVFVVSISAVVTVLGLMSAGTYVVVRQLWRRLHARPLG